MIDKNKIKNLFLKFSNTAQNKQGLALVEVLFSIGIIMIGGIIFAGVVQDTYNSSKISRDFLIAQNLAEETSETLEIVLNSNELLLNDEIRETQMNCWSFNNPNQLEWEICSKDDPGLSPGSYVPWFNIQEGRWSFFRVENLTLDLQDYLDNGEDLENLAPFAIYKNTDQNFPFYYFNKIPNPSGLPGDFAGEQTVYYRAVEILFATDEKVEAKIKIQWLRNGNVYKIEMPFLMNHPFN